MIADTDLAGIGLGTFTLDELLSKLLSSFFTLIALAAFASLIYSGFRYMSAGGDAAKAETARKNIVWALTGVIIATLSYGLIQLAASLGGVLNTSDTSSGETTTTTATPKFYVTDDGGVNPVTDHQLAAPSTQVSTEFRVVMESEPGTNGKISITADGDFPLTITPATLKFTDDDWSQSQPFAVSYNGDGQAGQTATVHLKAGSTEVKAVTFTIAPIR